MKGNEGTLVSLLAKLGGYRVASLAAVFILTRITNTGSYHRIFQQGILIFLSLGTIAYFVLCFYKKYLSILLLADYFAVFLYAYYEPHLVFAEFIWIPYILAAMALVLPKRLGVLVIPAMCAAGVFFSYGFLRGYSVALGDRVFPFSVASAIFYIPAAFLALFASRVYFNAEEAKKRLAALETVNSQLNELNRTVSRKLFNLQHDTTQKERNRLSKEIHDTAGYVFINLIMMLQAAAAVFNKDGKRAEKLITDARDYAERGINEIRHILRDVRDYAEVSLSLQNELYSVGDIFQKATGVEISIQYGNWPRSFSKPMDAFFTSFAQEALTNALKHGQATEIFIFCQDSGGIVSMTVSDNGAGAKLPVEKGIGISSLEDIANQYGGAVSMSSNKSGFKITVSVSRQTMEDGG